MMENLRKTHDKVDKMASISDCSLVNCIIHKALTKYKATQRVIQLQLSECGQSSLSV